MNTTPQPNLPSVEEVVAAFEGLVPEVGFEWCQGHQHDVEKLIRAILTQRDAYWIEHEHDMYESLEAAHQEAMGEMVREILDTAYFDDWECHVIDVAKVEAIARSRGVLEDDK